MSSNGGEGEKVEKGGGGSSGGDGDSGGEERVKFLVETSSAAKAEREPLGKDAAMLRYPRPPFAMDTGSTTTTTSTL